MTPYVAVDVGDEVFFTSTRDAGVGKQVFVGRWRKDMTVHCQDLLLVRRG